jgi:hypothetical protein
MTTTSPLYEATRNLPLKQIAALVRTEVRKTLKTWNSQNARGAGFPPDRRLDEIGVSVRLDGYRSISVDLQLSDALYDKMGEFAEALYMDRLTERHVRDDYDFMRTYDNGKYLDLFNVYQLEKIVEEIRNQYNYNNSDLMIDYFDVRYYGTTKFTKGKRGW